MLKCLFVKRKLYDDLENNLSNIDKIRVKNHLDVCSNCRDRLLKIKVIIDLAYQKQIPKPNTDFWHNFQIDLDRRLNERLIPPITIKQRLTHHLRPAFAYVAILIFVLVISSYFYKISHLTSFRIAENEELIDEIVTLDEIDQDLQLNHDEDAYLEEINLLYQLEQT